MMWHCQVAFTHTTPFILRDAEDILVLPWLQGNDNEYYSCDECKGKTAATLNMRIHRFPRILMLHIKRFTYTGMQKNVVN